MYIDFLFISLLINLSLYFVAYYYKTDKLTDISYALTFIILSFKGFLNSDFSTSAWILLFMHLAWAIRLGLFLGIRIHVMKKDDRFDKMRNNKWKFLGFWFLQAITVYIIMLPGILFWDKASFNIKISMFIGMFIWLVGLVIESVADWQKSTFFKTHDYKQQWLDTGLWCYSRHPNYFGEIMVWLGIYVFVAYSLPGFNFLIAILSPIFISFLLIFISGIPLLEKSAHKKFGHLQEYQKYKQTTSLLIPWFKK